MAAVVQSVGVMGSGGVGVQPDDVRVSSGGNPGDVRVWIGPVTVYLDGLDGLDGLIAKLSRERDRIARDQQVAS